MTSFAQRLADLIDDAVNAGTGRNPVPVDQVKAMAETIGYHTVHPFNSNGEPFLTISFPGDESELTISAVNDAGER